MSTAMAAQWLFYSRCRQALLLPAFAFAVLCAHAQYTPVKFSLVEGVGEISLGKITGIAQDGNGYMWFTDQDKNCITRFDGYNMRSYRFDPGNPNGLGGSYPECIYADDKGFIWIGFYGQGLDRFDPRTEQFVHYRQNIHNPNSLSSDTVSAIAMDKQGSVWIGTNNGLDVLDPGSGAFRHYRHNAASPASLDYNVVRSICIDRQGTVWVGTGIPWDQSNEGGLNRLDPMTGGFDHSLAKQKVRALYEDSRGELWAGTLGNRLYTINRYSGKATPHLIMPPPASNTDHITFIREDGTGLLWIGTFESGISRYNVTSSSVTHYGDGNGLMDNSGWQAYTSREGVFWFSTQSANLYRVDPSRKPYRFFPSKESVLGFAEPVREQIWMSVPHGLIFQQPWTKPVFININLDPSRNASTGNSQFLPAGTETQWVVQNGGLYLLNPANHELKPVLADSDFIRQAVAADKSHLLLATISGLYNFDVNSHKKTKIPGVPNDINALYIDKDRALWLGRGNSNGISRVDVTGKTTSWLKGHTVNCLYEDDQERFWAGTTNGAYVRSAGQAGFEAIRLKGSPIGTADVNGFMHDDSGYVWISSRSGIFQYHPTTKMVRQYGINQGVNSNVLTGAMFRKKSGEILVGSKAGFYTFEPHNLALESAAPQIVIREFKIAGKESVAVDSKGPVRLNYDQNIFSIGFAGMHFSSPGENIHLYKLEGYDPDWRKAGAERTAYYFNVPPGHYTFRVRVGNNEDIWAEKSLAVEIVPAWWTNIYFLSCCILALIACLYAAIRWRLRMQFRRQLEKSRTEQRLSELQRRSSELEMQALRSQMNPHFIFNSLNAVNRFILQNNSLQASAYLTKFSRLIRFILQNSEQAQVPLERELHALDLYLELEALRFDQHFTYTVKIDPAVDTQAVQVPPLIIQPYAENAIWHGLMHKEEPGHLEIRLRCDDNWLYCIVRDDGIGRKRAAELKSKSASIHKPMGMKITAGRMELLKKENIYGSAIIINDPVKKDGSSGGTEVILKIPLKYD